MIGVAIGIERSGEACHVFSRLYRPISTSLLKTIDRLGRALFVRVGAQKGGVPFVETDTSPIKTRAVLFNYASQNRITHRFSPFSLTELIEASNPNGFETVNLCSVCDAELCLLIVIAEFDRKKSHPHERRTQCRRFEKILKGNVEEW